jgi:hypothetical protein
MATVVPVFSIADVEKHLNMTAIRSEPFPPKKKKKKKKKKKLQNSEAAEGQEQENSQSMPSGSGLVMPRALSTPVVGKTEINTSQSCAMPQVSPSLNMSAQGSNEQANSVQLSPVQAKDPIMLDSAHKSIINSMAHKLGRNTGKGRQPSPQMSQDCQPEYGGGNFQQNDASSTQPDGMTDRSISDASSCAYPVALIGPAVTGPGVNHVSMTGVPNQPGMMASPYFNQNWLGSNIFPGHGLIPSQTGGIQMPVSVAGMPPVHVNVGQFVQGPLGIGLKSEGP